MKTEGRAGLARPFIHFLRGRTPKSSDDTPQSISPQEDALSPKGVKPVQTGVLLLGKR